MDTFFSVRDLAAALSVNKKRVHRLAAREHWPSRRIANRREFAPPPEVVALAAAKLAEPDPAPTVRFADLAHSDTARQITLLREQAVILLQNSLDLGKEAALQAVCSQMKKDHPMFRISVSSLRRWQTLYQLFGLDGLVEQKRGRVGRKPYAKDLATEEILRARADAVEHGIRGRTNIARAYRNLVASPTLSASARQWAHGEAASKSYVPPSVRDALRVPPLATTLIQIGPKAAKLDGPHTECSYDDVPPGAAFTADDMTANVYVWCEWPNSDGFLVLRPQVLAVMDVGSLCWLNTRVVIRPKGQYTKDDVWGLIGDTLDRYGVFRIAVLEGGTWQSSCVVGHKTGITDSDRVGGLESLGVKIIHTRSPRGKIIEGAFNQLQHAMDNCPGFCGRAEMKDCPEAVRQQLAQVRAGKAHPRQFFLHVHQFSDHLQGVMRALNAERNDGKILRGRSPDQAWAEAAVERPEMPDASKWLYRSAYSVVTVTRNGVRVTVGSGKYQQAYSYYHVALEPHRGRRVICYWNDYDPDTDAVIFSIRDGKPNQLLCAASRVPILARFSSDKEALHAEAARRKLAMQLAVSESRSLAPYLQRSAPVTPDVPSSPADEAAAHAIAQARQARADHVAAERQLQRRLDAVPLTDDDISAITSADRPEAGDDISAEDIRSLCSPDPTNLAST